MLVKAFPADVKVQEGERAVVAKISTVSVDRDGEVLVPVGCMSKDYEKNPIVLFNHNSYALPIGKCVSLVRDEKGITAKTVFASRPETYPAEAEWLPDTVLSLFQQGILKAFSVGFNPMDMPRAATSKDVEKYGDGVRRVIGKWNLLEYSVVTIPANQDAVATAVSKGFDAMREYITTPVVPEEKTFVPVNYEYVIASLSEKIERQPTDLKAGAFASALDGVRKAKGYVYPI